MTMLIAEVYSAFKVAGVPEKEAKEAAQAITAESTTAKAQINVILREILLIKWMLATVVAATVIPLIGDLIK